MSFHVKDDFQQGPASQVPTSWFNSVARFLNNLCGGIGIKVIRDTNPPMVTVDVDGVGKAVAAANFPTEDASAPDPSEMATVNSSFLAKDHWDAGVFTDVDENESDHRSGFSFYAVTRAKKVIDTDYLVFRKITVNAYGVITAMSAEEFAVAVADESAL